MASSVGTITLKPSPELVAVVAAMNSAVEKIAEIEGMKAVNSEREQRGESLAYSEEQFKYVADDMRVIGWRMEEIQARLKSEETQ